MRVPVTYVWTHDSIGLGEDGPTHQPVEHLSVLRAIPGLNIVRPADANETAIAWAEILKRHPKRAPHGLALTRQGVPTYEADADAAKGGYVRFEAEGGPARVVLIGTGSEETSWLSRPVSCSRRTASPRGSCRCRRWSGSTSRTRPTGTPYCRRP